MGKKRVAQTKGTSVNQGLKARALSRSPKTKIASGTLYVEATYNNTKVQVADKEGNTLFWGSSGSLGFRGAKKGTPFAAAKVGELLGEKAVAAGIKDVDVIIRGVGAGRESAVRAFSTKGIDISAIADETPVPHNGPKQKKARRV